MKLIDLMFLSATVSRLSSTMTNSATKLILKSSEMKKCWRSNYVKHGLVIIIDENKDRQFLRKDRKVSGIRNLFSPEEENSFKLHLDTISKF